MSSKKINKKSSPQLQQLQQLIAEEFLLQRKCHIDTANRLQMFPIDSYLSFGDYRLILAQALKKSGLQEIDIPEYKQQCSTNVSLFSFMCDFEKPTNIVKQKIKEGFHVAKMILPRGEYYGIPVSLGQTASMFVGEPYQDILAWKSTQTELTKNQLIDLFDVLRSDASNHDVQMEKFITLTYEQMIQMCFGDYELDFDTGAATPCGLMCDHLFIVTSRDYQELEDMSESLREMCGSDSSTYKACGVFVKLVQRKAMYAVKLGEM